MGFRDSARLRDSARRGGSFSGSSAALRDEGDGGSEEPANERGRDKKTRSRLGARTRGGSRRSRFRRTACVWRPRERTIACASGTSPVAFTRTCETSATPPTTRARRRSSPSTRPARVCTTPPPKGTCSCFRAAPTDDGFRPSRGIRKAKQKRNPKPNVKQRSKARAAARPGTAGPEAAAAAAGARRRGDEKRKRRRACTACFAGTSRRRARSRRTPTRRRCTPAARTGTSWCGARPRRGLVWPAGGGGETSADSRPGFLFGTSRESRRRLKTASSRLSAPPPSRARARGGGG
jgi:hypothetical protein